MQQEVGSGALRVRKIGTEKNVADLFTNKLSSEKLNAHMDTMRCKFMRQAFQTIGFEKGSS